MKIVGIVGKKNAGKSTVASLLVQKYDYHEFAFADPLKKILEVLFFLEPQHLHDPNAKEQMIEDLRVSPRRLMQQIGTDLYRDRLVQVLPELDLKGHTFWIWHMQQRIQRYVRSLEGTGKKPRIVISDVRFDDELKFVRDLEICGARAAIFEIIRDNVATSKLTSHESEELPTTVCSADQRHSKLFNNGSLEDLQKSVAEVMMFA